MNALFLASITIAHCGDYATAQSHADELVILATEQHSIQWKSIGAGAQGGAMALKGKAPEAIEILKSGVKGFGFTGTTIWLPMYFSYLARAHTQLVQYEDAERSVGEAMNAVKVRNERWYEAEVNRVAGETALASPEPDASKAEDYFQRALAVARQQQAKSWELRASMSLARLWRSQGKVQQARELLAPVYGWFTEGFDTRDLKQAKALLDELAS
jgi:predicted ATPase